MLTEFRDIRESPKIIEKKRSNLLFISVIFDPQSWYADSEIEIGSDLPPSFCTGYRSLIPEPPDCKDRQKAYNFMVALIYCTCLEGEEFQKYKSEAINLSKEISTMNIS